MEEFLEAVESALASWNWYAALTLSLALPDIAGWVDDPTQGSAERYQRWFDEFVGLSYEGYLGPEHVRELFLSGADCYALRCSFLHEGRDDISHQRARDALTRFQFIAPRRGFRIHMNIVGTKLQLQVDIFCHDICNGVRRWLAQIPADDIERRQRLSEILRI